MKLVEYKGKELLSLAGIKIPPGIVTNNQNYINLSHHKEKYKEFFFEQGEVVIKAQVIGGKRKKSGLISDAKEYADSLKKIDALYKTTYNEKLVDTLLIEKKLTIQEEYFLAILYDTKTKGPMIIFSKEGGIDVEEISKKKQPIREHIDPLVGCYDFQTRKIAKNAGFKGGAMLQIANIIKKAYACFEKFDCTHLEINPIIKTKEGILYAGDAKITIDENAIGRQEVFADVTDVEDKSFLNERELEARRIDLNDHRGVAGKTYVDLEGDIAVLASGGGASLTCMDAILEAGGKPANYTEYSGNPPREKVKKLTEVTLSKPGLKGCLIVGGRANFTDVFETLSGFTEGLLNIQPKPSYPIVIRRSGPRVKEAFEMLTKFAKEKDFDITLYGEETPMTKAAKILVEKIGNTH